MALALTLSVIGDVKRVERMLSGIRLKAVRPSASKSINRALTPGRNMAAAAIKKEINIRRIGKIKETLKISPSTVATLTGRITSGAAHKFNIVEFMSSARIPKRRGGGIKHGEFGGSHSISYGFLVSGKYSNKVIGVVPTKRTASGLRTLYSSHYVPEEFVKPEVLTAIEREVYVVFIKNFEHELQYRLSKL